MVSPSRRTLHNRLVAAQQMTDNVLRRTETWESALREGESERSRSRNVRGVHMNHTNESRRRDASPMHKYVMSLTSTLRTEEGIKLEESNEDVACWFTLGDEAAPVKDFRRLRDAIIEAATQPLCDDCGHFVYPEMEGEKCPGRAPQEGEGEEEMDA